MWLQDQLRRLDRRLMSRWAQPYERALEVALADCHTVLDVGCGVESPLSQLRLRFDRSVGVDAFAPALAASQAAGRHDDYVQSDVLRLNEHFADNSFDAVVALDLIEHLRKSEGLQLLQSMERIARRRVVVFTPTGFLEQGAYGGNEWQIHRSGWTPEEMRAMGYEVKGMNGWKPIRGEMGQVRFWPEPLWYRLSLLSQPLIVSHPERAFQMLCTKTPMAG